MDDLRESAFEADRNLRRLPELVGSGQRLIHSGGNKAGPAPLLPPAHGLLLGVAVVLEADPFLMAEQAAVVADLEGGRLAGLVVPGVADVLDIDPVRDRRAQDRKRRRRRVVTWLSGVE
jgi:hypothetical protein